MNITINVTGLDTLAAAINRIGESLERFGAPAFNSSVPALEASAPQFAAPPSAPPPPLGAGSPSPNAPPALPADYPAAGAASSPMDYEPVRRAITTFNLKNGKEATLAKLDSLFGVRTGKDIPQERWAEALAAFSAV